MALMDEPLRWWSNEAIDIVKTARTQPPFQKRNWWNLHSHGWCWLILSFTPHFHMYAATGFFWLHKRSLLPSYTANCTGNQALASFVYFFFVDMANVAWRKFGKSWWVELSGFLRIWDKIKTLRKKKKSHSPLVWQELLQTHSHGRQWGEGWAGAPLGRGCSGKRGTHQLTTLVLP